MLDNILFKTISFLSSPILGSVLGAWFVAQLIKSIIFLFRSEAKGKDLLKALVWTTGGMPSSHSATVCALTTSIGLKEGISSSIFMVCMTYAFITIRDALGVRYSTGEQAKRINYINKELNERFDIEDFSVKEIKGHSPSEVLVGCLIGIVLGFIFFYYG